MHGDLPRQGLQRGRGRRRGREAKALVRFPEARGLEVSAEVRERIRGCTDLDLLERWIGRAAVVESAGQVFD
ncbi:hypothetical protein EIO00_02230 [Thermomonospora catenispora]|nr:hypothetical protein EIO00_02230 [Thermomonospora catenispora]